MTVGLQETTGNRLYNIYNTVTHLEKNMADYTGRVNNQNTEQHIHLCETEKDPYIKINIKLNQTKNKRKLAQPINYLT